MSDLLEKIYVLINANFVGLEDRCRDQMSTSAVDQYLQQVHTSRKLLTDFIRIATRQIKTLKQAYNEHPDQKDYAQDYYTVWQQQAYLLQVLQDLQPQLQLRFVQAKQIRRRIIAEIGADYVPWSPTASGIPALGGWVAKDDPEIMRIAAEIRQRLAEEKLNFIPDDAT